MWGTHPRLQILTVGQLLAGKRLSYPHIEGMDGTFKKAPRALRGAEPQSQSCP